MTYGVNMKDYANKILNESAYFRELGLERIEATVRNLKNSKSFTIVIPKHQIKYRGVMDGDKIFLWWRRIDEDKRPNIKLLEREVNKKLALIKKAKEDLKSIRVVDNVQIDLDEEAEKMAEEEQEGAYKDI